MAICPLYSKILYDNLGSLSNGSGTHSKGSYSIEMIETEIASVWMDCITTNCQWWDATHSNCSIPVMNLFTYHKHDSHDHAVSHAAATVPADAGGVLSPPAQQSNASLLSQEYMQGEDKDGNSEVLGKDFGLDPTDTDVPKMLSSIINSTDFPAGLTTYTWAEYLLTLP